ncbi:MAG: HNH endonuclease [Polyangiaceae bacterium]|nr:HNH endonuclease [Polyangiaceae bacterium]
MTRKAIAETVVADLLVKTRRRCSLCVFLAGNVERKRVQIAHIDQDASNDAADNLVPLCLDHHDEYDSTTRQSKNITRHELRSYRNRLINSIADGTMSFGEPVISATRIAEATTSEVFDRYAYAWCVMFAKTSRILNACDPLGIAAIDPDEYDAESASPRYLMLPRARILMLSSSCTLFDVRASEHEN